ncbi:unnamed protein product [Cyprideis torosa]|uniref:Uncharacterized protein n=1 Tax=Cyprideis torosa TaxID=163714 RepID=A0A7R8ZKW6_9CRUS|nr:unnamed protein product [Cyprideis torosa]CAG0885271.1 unnamed protein product [Cyprideis torosa]
MGVLMCVHVVPPRWIQEPKDKAFALGKDSEIECKADGFPKPEINWRKAALVSVPGDYRELPANDPGIRVTEDGTLQLMNIQKSSEGYYLCEASNGIGSGLSAVVYINVQAPPQFEIRLRNQTVLKGDSAVLACEAKGEKPIGIRWTIDNQRVDAKANARYEIDEEVTGDGVKSELRITNAQRADTDLFTCVATNEFGSDETSISLVVQEPPEVPSGIKVTDKSGTTVKLQWKAPYDGNSPITMYWIEYKTSKGTWDGSHDKLPIPGSQTLAEVFELRPATAYHLRIIAENELGVSDASEVFTIVTSEEAPSAPPQDVVVEAQDQRTLLVTWKPPPEEHWNGDIQGYFIGHKLASSTEAYNYETVEFTKGVAEHHFPISNLKTYTKYSVVVQAFNRIGPGVKSEPVIAHTAEGAPSEPPQKTSCTALTAETIRVKWAPPPIYSINGIIKGYKVIYGPSGTWYDERTKVTKQTKEQEIILNDLKKYTNYSIQVLTYTAGGDGVKSDVISCHTEQDVPSAPPGVKAVVMGEDSILVSWLEPEEPNGVIIHYSVYMKETKSNKNKNKKPKKVPSSITQFEAKGLNPSATYEFTVSAATSIGEGPRSKMVTSSPHQKVPAKIASFGSSLIATAKENVTLGCHAVGRPKPEIVWKVKGEDFVPTERMTLLPTGSLHLREVNRDDAGDYVCIAENSDGKDSVTHTLHVLAAPLPPILSIVSSNTTSITIKISAQTDNTTPVHGYTVHYKTEFRKWSSIQLSHDVTEYELKDLWCGTMYEIYAEAFNNIGKGKPSEIVKKATKGQRPKVPPVNKFLEVASSSVTLHLNAWDDGGCPMLYFIVEYRTNDPRFPEQDWTMVSNNVQPAGNFVVLDLQPATWYLLRVTAHNNAGWGKAEYDFATLTLTGGTIAPVRDLTHDEEESIRPHYYNLAILGPCGVAVGVVILAIIVVCYVRAKNMSEKEEPRYGPPPVLPLDKRHSHFPDELGYIAPPNRKLPPVPGGNFGNFNTINNLKRAPVDDDICPYATFHLLGFREEQHNGDPNNPNFQTFPHPHSQPQLQQEGGKPQPRMGTQTMPHRPAVEGVRQANGKGPQTGNPVFSPEYDDPAGGEYEEHPYDEACSGQCQGTVRRQLPGGGYETMPPPPPFRMPEHAGGSQADGTLPPPPPPGNTAGGPPAEAPPTPPHKVNGSNGNGSSSDETKLLLDTK